VIARGDIRWFRFSTPDKRRPVLLLGNEDVLSSLSEVPVIPLSTQIRNLPWEVLLGAADGLPGPCTLKPEWIKCVDRTLIGPWISTIHESRWGEVKEALLLVLGFRGTSKPML
jgi:mRNA interferase MazF